MNMCCTLIFCSTTGGNHINGQSATWPHGWSDRTAQVHRRRAGRDFRQEVHNLISSLLHHSSSHNYPEWWKRQGHHHQKSRCYIAFLFQRPICQLTLLTNYRVLQSINHTYFDYLAGLATSVY